jgi:hypothetical protein
MRTIAATALVAAAIMGAYAQNEGWKQVVDNKNHTVTITLGEEFAQQDITEKLVNKTYKKIKKSLPRQYNKHKLIVMANGMPIEDYIPGRKSDNEYDSYWDGIDYKGKPWVSNISKPNNISLGLSNRHIALWASHGRYYDQKKGLWKWQRPNLFCTTEDLFTQTIVVPYLIPMLENAGATVFTPRERDWQTKEIIVDNDKGVSGEGSWYGEHTEKEPWTDTGERGFGFRNGILRDGENPFTMGTARMIRTTKKEDKAIAIWQPNFKEEGRYAVYVSYQTMQKSVDDAHYIVRHKGQETHFIVNQKMGGGTWVYLGTFDFDKGENPFNCVALTNQSKRKGVVTADAVRFGGGMGNIERGGDISHMPRCLEAARYYAQWAGAPYSIYGNKTGTDDYAEDINTRSLMTNWLAGGSPYVPTKEGKNVPIELSLAVHSDAGYERDGKSLVGSLAICTTSFNDGRLNSGISRFASQDFIEALRSNVTRDLSKKYKRWNWRYLWDRNYSETRLPEVPSAIIETLSHQNFPDMKLGQDPNFKFTMARSIYKTILRYVSQMHRRPCIVQPLQPHLFKATLTGDNKVKLSWKAQDDELEPTAVPTSYNIYVAAGSGGFDNGTNVRGTSYTMELEPGVMYRFKVTAVNRGGESFPTSTLSAYYQPGATKTAMVINGFSRLSAPAVRDNIHEQGFDIEEDAGVSYGLTAGWSGKQQCFNKSTMGSTEPNGLGYSGNEMAGNFVMGNTFDYVYTHADAIAATKKYNVVSCTSETVESGIVDLINYDVVDLALGLQKYDENSTVFYKSIPSMLRNKLSAYVLGHGKLIASGAYIGSDLQHDDERVWLESTLKVAYGGAIHTDTISGIKGMGTEFDFYRQLNPTHYAATKCDVLMPVSTAFCPLQYANGMSAGVAYKGNDNATFTMAFPFECIIDRNKRLSIMNGILKFLE